jgi:crotonobetainyl-CoA:carnitine CoA-transferase CaiB-like acyl-CoA transferase
VGYAPTFAALGGISHITGYEDWPPSNFMGSMDLRSATTSAFAILNGLIYRHRSGEGQYIDLASQETIAVLAGDIFLDFFMNQRVPGRKGNRDEWMAPHNCYRCRGEDQWVSIAVATDSEWQALCRVMGRPELIKDARFHHPPDRLINQEVLDDLINQWTKDKDYYEVTKLLQEAGVAAAPSLSSEGLFKDPHLREREVYSQLDHPFIGQDWVIAPPWRLSETPARIYRHSPLLGEHNEEIFGQWLGLSAEEIQELEKEEVIY